MQIDTLRYFEELVRVGSFYGAAKRIFISQQGLNKAVSSLEAELGVKLIERENRGVRLTSAGEIFHEHAKVLLAEYSDTLKDLYAEHAVASVEDGRLSIHMTYYCARIAEPFVKQMKSFSSLNLIEEPFQRILEGASASDGSELFLCDLYGPHNQLTGFPDLIFEPIVAARVGIVRHQNSSLKLREAVHRDQIADAPLSVDSHKEMMRLVDYIMDGKPLGNIQVGVANPKGRLEYAHQSEDIALILDSLGFTLAQSSPTFADPTLVFTPFSTPRSIIRIGFFYPKKARPNVRARHIIEVLRAHLRTNYADYLEAYPL